MVERRVPICATSLVALATVTLTLSLREPVSTTPEGAVVANTFSTGWKQQREVQLADGSTVWLDWNTHLIVELSSSERHARLERGSAAFQIRADTSHPFYVKSGDVVTRVTGTEFVVSRHDGDVVEVAVLEGEVRVSAGKDNETILGPAQVVSVRDSLVGRISKRSLAEIGQWRSGVLVFRERPVLEVLKTLTPYTQYIVDASAISDHKGRVSGTFFIDQADDALFTLLQVHRIDYEFAKGDKLQLHHGASL